MLLTQMDPAAWDPFAELWRLRSDVNRLFDDAGAWEAPGVHPPVSLWLGETSVVVTAELPGLTSDDIDLSIRESTLTIQGERKPAEAPEGATWHRRERGFGAFARTVELPYRVDPDRVKARFVDGVLEVEMERPQSDLPRKVKIEAK